MCYGYGLTLIDVIRPIRSKPVRIQRNPRIWTQSSQILPTTLLDQRRPSSSIFRSLCSQTRTYSCKTIGFHATNMLARTARVLQRQSHGYIAHKVDVADVDEDLGRVECELAEAEVDIVVGIVRIEDGGLNEAWAGVDSEGQWSADREPDPAACYARDGRCYCVSGGSETDGDVGGDGRAGLRGTGRVVWSLCICLEDE